MEARGSIPLMPTMRTDEEYQVLERGSWCWWIIWDENGLWAHYIDPKDVAEWKLDRPRKLFRDTLDVTMFFEYGEVTVRHRETDDEITIPKNWKLN